MKRGISEATVYVYNPLPPIEDGDVLAKSGLDDTAVPSRLKPLCIDWSYSFGDESEFIRLQPGDRKPLRESDAAEMMAERKEQGLVVIPLDADEKQIHKAKVEGVRAALAFYIDRGNKRLTNLRKIHNHDRQAMEDSKHDHWSFYYNQAIADLLREHLATLNKPASKAATKAA